MMMTANALLAAATRIPARREIRQAISGNLCRCTGYVNIVKAVQYAAAKLRGADHASQYATEQSDDR